MIYTSPPDRAQTNVVIYSLSTLGAFSKCRPSVWCAPGVSNDNSKVFASETQKKLTSLEQCSKASVIPRALGTGWTGIPYGGYESVTTGHSEYTHEFNSMDPKTITNSWLWFLNIS